MDQWTHIIHEVGTIIFGVAAVIAAVSSLKNGRTLNGHVVPKLTLRREKKRIKSEDKSGPDWYTPPDL